VPSDRRRHRAPWVADENQGTRTRPTVAAVASLNWPYRYDAKFERLAKSLNANIHAASSYVYTLNSPTRLPEDPFLKTAVTFSALDALALSITDNEAVERVNKARTQLFDKIRLARKRA
jgi:hypothetical protein